MNYSNSSTKNESGFTLIEVLVTILVVTGFVLGSLQAVVLATFFRVQAQDKNEALNWVQQDLELIRYQAFSLDLLVDGHEPDGSICANSTYGQELLNQVNSDFPLTQTVSINGKSYDIQRIYQDNDNTLQISHIVTYNSAHPRYQKDGDNTVTQLSTEAIPDVALSCE
ncbi:type II secretion system protein [Cyanobacterium stanieri]|uniref:type II secretion system protein n=1 Tax=Cyanobacterium stanieri TaxID=102235 RepID=UPI00188104C6|nr:type II secretion system protein [Cyanobacterium stanieri]